MEIVQIIICKEKLLQMKKLILIFLFFLFSGQVYSQHEHHKMNDTLPKKSDTVKLAPVIKGQIDHSKHKMSSMQSMPSHAYSRNLSMSRNGSGTGWNPDASPMHMWMKSGDKTDWMLHGSLFLRFTSQDIFSSGSRGAHAFSAPNWFMAMMNKKVGEKGLLNAVAMISLDRFTEGGNGYPLLFQSGETYKDQRLVDRQHPHDLFSALSIGYTQMLSKNVDVYGYFGYPGEPALGANAFMHRPSAINNPDAPLGHHWQDATHITFGVATLGVRYKKFKTEGSVFTGREPDENRYDFDKARFDSYSYRLSYNPSENWALQFSRGFINSPEALEPGEDLTRTSASVLYSKKWKKSHYDVAAIWGYNHKSNGSNEHSLLLEDNHSFGKNSLYSRYEFVQKSKEELDLHNGYPDKKYSVHAFTTGYNRQLRSFSNIALLAGTQFTVYGVDKGLHSLYGKTPVGFQVYIQLRPSVHNH